ncbi:MAG: phage portal protein [Actinomyces sp.]|nr:MAG: phage portal protein [Actinomyces sp.]
MSRDTWVDVVVDDLEASASEADHYGAIYSGDLDEIWSSARLARAAARAGAELELNLAARIVDAALNRLTITGVGDDEVIGALWDRNDLRFEHIEAHRWTLVHGHGALVVWPADPDGPADEVDIVFHPATELVVHRDPEDARIVDWAARSFVDRSGRDRLVVWTDAGVARLARQGVDAPWVPVDAAGTELAGPLTTIGAMGVDPVEGVDRLIEADLADPHDLARVPVFELRTRHPRGVSDLATAAGPQALIAKLVAADAAVIEFASFPQRYFLLDPATASGDFGDFDDISDPVTPGATAGSGSELTSLTAGPGELWTVTAREAGQFDPARAAEFIERLEFYARHMAAASSTPVHELRGQPPSGEALRAADEPLVRRVRDRQARFEATWRDALTFAADLVDPGADHPVEITWSPAEFVDRAEALDEAERKVRLGVPPAEVLVELGYERETVEGWIAAASQGDTRDIALTLAAMSDQPPVDTAELRAMLGLATGG